VVSGVNATWVDARTMIKTDSTFGAAKVDFNLTNPKIKSIFTDSIKLSVVPGFIASDAESNTTTLGRGGSDYTAAIIAAALSADVLEIWTDVSGMMTADPRLCLNAKIISTVTYREAMELSHFGAKVIYPPTIQPVMTENIPVWIKNTFSPEDPGTVISSGIQPSQYESDSKSSLITGISSINKISLITLEGSGMIGIPGFSKRFFDALSRESVNVIFITQSSSEHSITVGIEEDKVSVAVRSVNEEFDREMFSNRIEPLMIEKQLSIIAVVGEQMHQHTGISGKMFGALGRNGINIRAIAQGSSEMNISAVVATSEAKKAVNVLHEAFFETTYKQVNIFLAGTGNVGKKLISQIQNQLDKLQQNLSLQLRVAGIINSRKMKMSDSGIDLDQWEKILNEGEEADVEKFAESMISLNLRNSIFVDVTAHENVSLLYERLLQKSISVVACNKIAASSAFSRYKKLKELATEYNAHFLFETNVGAGLPIIGTINDLVNSGDRIRSIEAVLSGTLNFVFNTYDGNMPFSDVVALAKAEGYTEPDPRLDLGGTDVMRKILILAREAGVSMEFDQIKNNRFMPDECMTGTIEEFFTSMKTHESHFSSLYQAAQKENKKLKFVASYDGEKASVGLQKIGSEHDFYHLYGKDNVVLFYTDRYSDQPLVIKGAGAGADVTASGVFADIIRATKK
jgi:aspartokinase/homoserine dehydrogenase 1